MLGKVPIAVGCSRQTLFRVLWYVSLFFWHDNRIKAVFKDFFPLVRFVFDLQDVIAGVFKNRQGIIQIFL